MMFSKTLILESQHRFTCTENVSAFKIMRYLNTKRKIYIWTLKPETPTQVAIYHPVKYWETEGL